MIEAVFQELEASGSDTQGLQTVSLVQVWWKQGWPDPVLLQSWCPVLRAGPESFASQAFSPLHRAPQAWEASA